MRTKYELMNNERKRGFLECVDYLAFNDGLTESEQKKILDLVRDEVLPTYGEKRLAAMNEVSRGIL